MKSLTAILFIITISTSCNSNLKSRIVELEEENTLLKNKLEKTKERSAFELINNAIINQSETVQPERNRTLTEYIEEAISEIDSSKSINIISTKNELLQKISDLDEYLVSVKELLIEKNGGYDNNGWINNAKETKTVEEVIFGLNKGEEMKEKLVSCIKALNSKAELTNLQSKELPLRINLKSEENGQLWHEYIFRNMPIGATLPIFSKLENDCKSSKLYILNILKEKL